MMEGLRGDHGSIAALCNAYGITQTDFYRWRDILMEDGSRLFERGGVDRERQRLEDENHKLREAVGSLTMELKKRLVMAARKRRVRKESPANVQLLEKIRALKCDHPSWGYKRIAAWLRRREHMKANHKRVLRLMKADGLLVPKNLRLHATRRNSSTEKAKPKTIEPNRFRGTDMTRTMLPQSGWGLSSHCHRLGRQEASGRPPEPHQQKPGLDHGPRTGGRIRVPDGDSRPSRRLRRARTGQRPRIAACLHRIPRCLRGTWNQSDLRKLRQSQGKCRYGTDDADNQGGSNLLKRFPGIQ